MVGWLLAEWTMLTVASGKNIFWVMSFFFFFVLEIPKSYTEGSIPLTIEIIKHEFV